MKQNSDKNFYLQFCTAEAARAAHGQTRANACNPIPQCFQIWQVSAKYCTFLDFLAHCCGKTDSECQTFLEKTLIVQPAEEFSGETAAQVD